MKISREGIALIKKWEGCRLMAYQDSAGVWTIGYGTTTAAGLGTIKAGMTISQQQADDWLVAAIVKYEAAVSRALTRAPSQNQFDAFVSLCYNIGESAFSRSTAVKLFNAGDIPGAANAILLWRKAGGKVLPGLENRRADERALFLAAKSNVVPTSQPVAKAGLWRRFWAWLKGH